ncbi:hypothetical protein [Candidatus Poriferisodalis sp.]|uniref:hypothetical protein n=1 Tax=Candidatus Poriferisodalis sp. TaxID=3101277 RepID=UPI003C6FEBCD
MAPHVDRRMARIVSDRLAEEPEVALQGPRTVGKSTLLAEIARCLEDRIFVVPADRLWDP